MINKAIILMGVMFLLMPIHAMSKEVTQTVSSAYGFDIDVPASWLALNKQNTEKKSSQIGLVESFTRSFIDKEAIQEVLGDIVSGQSEMFFIPHSTPDALNLSNDNVNIISSIGTIPEKETFKDLCEATEEQISTAFEKFTKLDFCEYRQLKELESVYLEFAGLKEGTRNSQYHVHALPNIYLVFSLTAKNDNFHRANKNLLVALKTIRFR